MNNIKIHRHKTGLFSDLSNQLVYNQDDLKEFIQAKFSLEAFEEQMKIKSQNYSLETRKRMAAALNSDYSQYTTSAQQQKNLDSLAKENTYTVTTGHQLSLLTGPLYFVLKILHTVKLAEELRKKYSNSNFVPIFWMASEDHDFEEINQVNLFNQKFSWDTQQTGAVGRFSLENWSEFIQQIKGLFANHPNGEIQTIIDSYDGKNLGEATFKMVNTLFNHEGVLVLDADNAALKSLFAPTVKKELTENLSFKAVEKTNQLLAKEGLPTQAFAREINIFLLEKGSRERIQYENGVYFTDAGTRYSKEDILAYLETNPEEFSPNVILRPLYQELILPNLCYLGGGGEMAYWLQLKGAFESYNVPYPLIQVRNSMMIIDSANQQKMENVGWSVDQLFEDVDALKKSYVLENAEELDLSEMRQKQNELIESCRNLVNAVDPNMSNYLEAEMTRLTKQMDTLEQKLIRAEKSKYEKVLKQMDQIKDKLFPNNGLQERSANFFNFCSDGEVRSHLDKIKSAIDPFEKDFIVLYL
jgi:bacillithiol biosynthesis cysteine-adding enzyme BshC|tara:strand:+ start:68571 stop:70154 length:1584 start_codon:yes stop_codon:yes gene_type:complete